MRSALSFIYDLLYLLLVVVPALPIAYIITIVRRAIAIAEDI